MAVVAVPAPAIRINITMPPDAPSVRVVINHEPRREHFGDVR
jgi:hypothetical protein